MNQDQVILRSVSQTPCIGTNTGVTLMPQQEQQQDFEHGFQPGNESQKAFSEFRIKQLHNRRFMLLEMQRFRKKDDGVSTTGEPGAGGSGTGACYRNTIKPSGSRGFFGCCLIPFFNDRFKNVQHWCPRCQAKIHTYEPI
ncbi:hypothetical protein F7725_014007 [Dissostichus mawsoni]|uniref:LITAF domain-containing protein n=1 Tax=Dissostichus mawsoni TaxID=36200 RepID=A0A7J5YX68_DISMA|nr:hypothetical protein F7725_014007 [Dissostichus mawsoni]